MSGTATQGEPALQRTYLTPQQLAAMLPGVTTGRLAMWRYEGKGPKFRKLGRTVLYALDEVEAWIESTTRQSTAHEG
tara:strand:+ start:472 stop:702 length:231 start_codon:yes stop_codon:yes gene_type:complete